MTKTRTATTEHPRTRTEVEFQLRNGVPTAIIGVESYNEVHNGRGYSHQYTTNRQVLVLPIAALAGLSETITGGLTYQVTGDDDERFDLDNEAERRYNIYGSDAVHTSVPRWSFYTLAEARAFARVKEAIEPFSLRGYTIRHRKDAESGDPMSFATSVIETL